MRTTISISDELFLAAKTASLERSCTLGEVIEDALKVALLARKTVGMKKAAKKLKTFSGGGIQPGVDLRSNQALNDLMDS